VRFETTSLTNGWAPAIEVMAYGTALVPATVSVKETAGVRSEAAAVAQPSWRPLAP
jgi:hypothetical protein